MSAKYGVPFKSLLMLDYWFGRTRNRKTLWRADRGKWVEVAISTSARVLSDKFTRGWHVVVQAGVDPNCTVDVPMEIAPSDGVLFA